MSGLIVLDIDGTLVDGAGAVPDATRGVLQDAASAGYEVALITGRGLPRALEVVDTIATSLDVSPLLGLEHGGRVLRRDDLSTVAYTALAPARIGRLVDSVPRDAVEFVAFHPRAEPGMSRVWAPVPRIRSQLEARFTNAEFVDYEWETLAETVAADEPCMVTVRLAPGAEFLDPDAATWAGRNTTLVERPDLKADALRHIATALGADLDSVIVAGDEWTDAPMLGLVPPRRRVLVGGILLGSAVDEDGVQHVRSPAELGPGLRDAIGQQGR